MVPNLIFGSKLEEWTAIAKDVEGSANDAANLARNANDQIGSNNLRNILSVGKHLALSGTFANYTTAFSDLFATVKGEDASKDQRIIIEKIEQANGKLSRIEESTSTEANVTHQLGFGESVYNFVSQQTRINQRYQTATMVSKPDEPEEYDHYFFVLHPANDWHPAFDEARRMGENPLPGFVGYTADRFALGVYLRHMREAIGSGPEFHVLIPSACHYRLPGVVDVDPAILPLTVQGQTERYGRPYCSATIVGLDSQHIVSVENLPLPQFFDVRKGGFRANSTDVIFQAPAKLSARCLTDKGSAYKHSSIILDDLLGVEDGAFKVGGKNFSKSVHDAMLDADGVTFRAMIRQPDGRSKACAINLEAFISNDNGVLRRYDELSPSQKCKAGAAGTGAGVASGLIGFAVGGPVGAVVGTGLGAWVTGVGVEEDLKDQKRKRKPASAVAPAK